MIYKNLKFKFENFIIELSKLFKETITKKVINEFISKSNNGNKSKIYNGKIDVNSLIFYMFHTFFSGETKTTSSDKIKKDINVDRSCLSKKAKKIPFEFFEYLRKKVFILCQKYSYNYGNKITKKIISGDGTTSIDQNFDVSLNLGFYDVTNDLPLNLSFEGHENRNRDVKLSIKYIKDHIDIFKNSILLLDAFYYDINLIDFLLDNKIYFIINGRQNVDNYDITKDIGKMTNDRKLILENIRPRIKILSYDEISYKTLHINKKKDGYYKTFSLKINKTINLITYLPKSYSDEKIKHLYKERWVIETFFSIVKNNFNYNEAIARTENEQKIRNECALIITYIIKTIKKYILSTSTKMSTDTKKVNVNETRMIENFKELYLKQLIIGNLTVDNVHIFIKKFCPVVNVEKNRHRKRHSKTPYSKWNFKCNSDMAEIKLVVKCMDMNTLDLLDKNKKLMVKKITILKTVINTG